MTKTHAKEIQSPHPTFTHSVWAACTHLELETPTAIPPIVGPPDCLPILGGTPNHLGREGKGNSAADDDGLGPIVRGPSPPGPEAFLW